MTAVYFLPSPGLLLGSALHWRVCFGLSGWVTARWPQGSWEVSSNVTPVFMAVPDGTWHHDFTLVAAEGQGAVLDAALLVSLV